MIKDRAFETSTTSGTGSYTLLGAITGGRSFQDAFGAGPVKVYYFAVPANADGSFECGIGTFTGPTTLARTSIIASSNANAAVSWGSEVKNIFCAPPGDLLDRLNDIVNCGTAGGSANSITLSPNVPVAEYSTDDIYLFTADNDNTGPTNANVSTLGDKSIQINGAALTGGEIVSGKTYGLRYDGTALQLLFFETIPSDTTASQIAYAPGSPALIDASNVQDALDALAATKPAFFAYKPASAGNQSIPATTHTKVTFGTETLDNAGAFANSRFTPLRPRVYQVSANVMWNIAGSTTIEYRVCIWKNGVGSGTLIAGNRLFPNADTIGGLLVSAPVEMNGTTDYLEVGVYISSGPKDVLATDNIETWFSAACIS